MKRLLIFVLVTISIQSFGQNPGNYTSINGRYRWQGGMFDSGLHVPRYNGTPSGLRIGMSPNSGAVAIDTIGHTSFFYSGDKWRNQGSFSFETRIIQGGIVSWDSLLIFSVSAATYYINGAFYTSALTKITLDAAHATLDRIDLIYLDSTGAHKETGTAAATPAEPNLPPNSIRLTAIQIPATSVVPGGGVDTLIIYDENVEWVGSTSSVTVDFDNTVSPFHFVKATSTGAITNLSTVKYTASTPIDISDYDVLRFRIKLKAVFNNNTYLRIYFTSTASNVHVPVELRNGLFGFNRSSLVYQEISIPIAALSFINTSVDGLYFQSSGSNASGFYLDWIQLFANIDQAPPQQENHKFGEGDITAIGDRAFNAQAYNFSINNVNEFIVGRSGITRIYQNSSASGLYSPNGINHNYVTNSFAGFNVSSGANYFLTLQDSSKTAKKISYEGNLHGLFNAYTLVDKSYVDSVAVGAASQWISTGSDIYYNTGLVGIGNTGPTSKLHVETGSIGVTQSDAYGLLLRNPTAAAAGAQQMSPALILAGNGWKTDATAASQDVRFRMDVLPIQGSGSPTGTFGLSSSVNGGAYTERITIASGGGVTVPNGIFSVTGNVTFNSNQFQVSSSSSVSNHYAAGSTSSAGVSLYHLPTRTWSADADGFSNFFGNPSVTEASSGAHKLIANVFVGRPEIINGTATTTNAASLYVLGSPIGTAAVTNNYGVWVDSGAVRLDGRVLMTQGADVASVAGAIALGSDGNSFEITGTNAITLISNLGWQNGSEITLIFTSTATLTDGTANSGTDIGMELEGNTNFIATADDIVTLVLCEIGGTQRWRMKGKSIN